MSSQPSDSSAILARLQKLEAVLQCPLCHALPTAPVALSGCGHHFCSQCIRSFLSYEGNSFCPQLLCKVPATTTHFVPMPHLDYRGGAHADFDRNAPRLPHLIGASAASLRKKLQELGVPTTGDLSRLEGRHKAYVNAYNVSLDGGCGSSKLHAVVLKAVRAWDKTQDELVASALAKEKLSRAGVKRGMFRNSKAVALLGKRPCEDSGREMTTLCDVGNGLGPDDIVRAGDSVDEMARKIRRIKEARKTQDSRLKEDSDGAYERDLGSSSSPAHGSGSCGEASGGNGNDDEVIILDGKADHIADGGGENKSYQAGSNVRRSANSEDDVVVVKLFESDDSLDIPIPPPSPRGLDSCDTKTADVCGNEVLQTDGLLSLGRSSPDESNMEAENMPAPVQTCGKVLSPKFSGNSPAADGPAFVGPSPIHRNQDVRRCDQSPVDVALASSAATSVEPSAAEPKDRQFDSLEFGGALSPVPRVTSSSSRPSGVTASADEIQRKKEEAQEKLRMTKRKQDIARKKKEAIAKQMQARQRRLVADEALRRQRLPSAAFPGQGR